MKKLEKTGKAISPIIATLLLILIAIAAGVVVYAYVIGFVGNSTGGGTTQGLLSFDLISATGGAGTSLTNYGKSSVFVRNTGSIAEKFNNGFYVKGQSLASTQLSFAALVSTSGTFGGTATITLVMATSNTITVTETGMTAGSMTVNFLGGSIVLTFGGTTSGPITIVSTMVSGTAFTIPAANTVSGQNLNNIAVPVTMSGTLTLAVGGLQEFDLTSGSGTSGLALSSGSSYTITIVAADGTTVSQSVKAA